MTGDKLEGRVQMWNEEQGKQALLISLEQETGGREEVHGRPSESRVLGEEPPLLLYEDGRDWPIVKWQTHWHFGEGEGELPLMSEKIKHVISTPPELDEAQVPLIKKKNLNQTVN